MSDASAAARFRSRWLPLVLSSLAVLWATAVVLIPFHAGSRSSQPSPLITAAVYATGALICHQRPERSFHAGAARLPVCARCTGLYLSGACGALAGWLSVAAIPRRTRLVLIAAALPTAVTWIVEWSGLAQVGNVARAVAALPLGGVTGWLFIRMLRAGGVVHMRYDPVTYGHEIHRSREGPSRF